MTINTNRPSNYLLFSNRMPIWFHNMNISHIFQINTLRTTTCNHENLVITTDEALHEISSIKENVKKDILTEIKSSSIDCSIHSSGKENIVCYSVASDNPNDYLTVPSFTKEQSDKFKKKNVVSIAWTATQVTIDGKKYAFKSDAPSAKTGELYDLESYKNAKKTGENPVLVARLVKNPQDPKKIRRVYV